MYVFFILRIIHNTWLAIYRFFDDLMRSLRVSKPFGFVEILTCCTQWYIYVLPNSNGLGCVRIYCKYTCLHAQCKDEYTPWIWYLTIRAPEACWMKAEMGSLPDEVQAHSGISFCHDRFVWFACYTVNGVLSCFPQSEVRLTKMRPKPATQL